MAKRKPKAVTLMHAAAPRVSRHIELAEDVRPDPFEPSKNIRVITNARESGLAWLRTKGRIDDAQLAAGARFARLLESAEVGSSRAIDYSRDKVDGGRYADPHNDRMMQAAYTLKGVRQAVGRDGYTVLSALVCGASVSGIAATFVPEGRQKRKSRAEWSAVMRDIQAALNALVEHFEMVAVRKDRATIAVERDLSDTGPALEWEIGRFGDLVEKKRA